MYAARRWVKTQRLEGVPHDRAIICHSRNIKNKRELLFDSHIQRIVLATEETTVTQQVSHRPIKYQSRSWPQRGTKVNGSHNGDNLLLRPTGIEIATKPLPGPTNREHRKGIRAKTIYLGTNSSFYCLEEYKLKRRLSVVLPIQQSHHELLIQATELIQVSQSHTSYRIKEK